MAHDGSDTYSEDSGSSIMEHGLFPSMKDKNKLNMNSNQSSDTSSRNSYHIDYLGNDSASSIGDLRHMFLRNNNNNNSRSQSTPNAIPYTSTNNDNIHVDSVLDSSDSATIETSTYSIDSSIINRMPDVLKVTESGDRFKYLKTYEKIKKDHDRDLQVKSVVESMKNHEEIPLQVLNSHSSIFELSQLDDFNRYLKQTELNDLIYAKVAKSIPISKEHDFLNVVQNNELVDNFYVDHEFKDERTKSLKPARLKTWYGRHHHLQNSSDRHQAASKSSISELNFENSPSSSDNSNEKENKIYLQRKLKVRHLQMISLGGTLGVGLFLNSGKALTIAGGLGTLLAFIICGIIVLATMVSFCEMVTFVSVVDGVSGLSSRFVDDAFGFAVGWLYFVSFSFGLAGEVVASVIMLSYYQYLDIPDSRGSSAGFVTLFLTIVVLSNLIDVRIFGEIEYISSFIKLLAALIMIIVMIVLNRGGFGGDPIGFRYWNHSKSDFDHNLIFGLFRPTFNLHDTGTNDPSQGIGGGLGRFLSILVALLVVSYAYSGTEIVCIAACEAKNPRKALPSATKRVFWRILLFYCLSAFCVSLNIYAGDPRLLRYYSGNTGISQNQFSANYAIQYAGGVNCNTDSIVFAGFGSGAQSPWIVALQSAGLCNFSAIVNGFLVFFAVSCGNAQLYVSSRTVYSMALQGKAPKFLTYCSRQGIPYNAVLFAASFGLLSFICVSEKATVVFQNLTSIIASSGIIVWFAMCLSFVRFYYGLRRRPDIINRDDKAYPYRSPFQPYSAIIGLIGTSVILLCMGFVVFLKSEWNTMFFFSSYGTLMVFAVLYIGYKIIRGTRIPTLDTIDFDSGRTEMDRYIWDGGREYNATSIKDILHKCISFLA
ncbi:amino acid permease-domain-containing protein [Scheffersomyces amazonensis]|uniref:amino acid permease-domain-containing protein n=1 Tax=Scheffersomyces amazonensis TaxID=1078765 RepID=UPI00315DA559